MFIFCPFVCLFMDLITFCLNQYWVRTEMFPESSPNKMESDNEFDDDILTILIPQKSQTTSTGNSSEDDDNEPSQKRGHGTPMNPFENDSNADITDDITEVTLLNSSSTISSHNCEVHSSVEESSDEVMMGPWGKMLPQNCDDTKPSPHRHHSTNFCSCNLEDFYNNINSMLQRIIKR